MDAFFTNAHAGLLLPRTSSRRMSEIEVLRLAAMAERDAAVAGGLRRGAAALVRGAAAVLRAVVAFPSQLATYKALHRLSDRELRDIGMTRHDIGRVFETDFAPRPANDAGERPSPRAA